MHIKTASRIKLSKLSCIISTLNSCLPWRCAVALVLDGRALAKQIEENLLVRVEALKAKTGRTPILATILVGDDGASATYVRMKGNACRRVGMDSLKIELPQETTTEQLLAEIESLMPIQMFTVFFYSIQFLSKLMSAHVLMRSL